MTPEEVKSQLAGDPTFDAWAEPKQLWFCGRVVSIQSTVESMKDTAYGALLAKLKSSLRKTVAALEPLRVEAIDYLAGGLPPPNMSRAMEELRAFDKTAERLRAMPVPVPVELASDAGGDPGSRRKWRNGMATAMTHELIQDAGVRVVKVEGSPSMKLMARVLDCLQRRRKPRKTDTARKRLSRSKGKIALKK